MASPAPNTVTNNYGISYDPNAPAGSMLGSTSGSTNIVPGTATDFWSQFGVAAPQYGWGGGWEPNGTPAGSTMMPGTDPTLQGPSGPTVQPSPFPGWPGSNGPQQNQDGTWTYNGVTTPVGWQPPPYDPSKPITAAGSQTSGATPTTGGSTQFGGGWDQFATQAGSPQYALQQLLKQGITGQAAIDILNKNPATAGIAYYPQSGNYGFPNGYYAAPNQSGSLDLIQRSGGGGGGHGGGVGGQYGYGQYGQAYGMPSSGEFQGSPGFKWATDQGLKALSNLYGSRGTFLTGGMVKAATGYATGAALQDYNNYFNQRYAVDQGNYGIWRNNQNDTSNWLYNMANLGKPGS